MKTVVGALVLLAVLPLSAFAGEDDTLVACPSLNVDELASVVIKRDGAADAQPYFAEITYLDGSSGIKRLANDPEQDGKFEFWHGEYGYRLWRDTASGEWKLEASLAGKRRTMTVSCE